MPANRALLALGSNIRPEANLTHAVQLLAEHGAIGATSRVWQSAPVGFSSQPDFLNAAVLLETTLPPEQIIGAVIPVIERALDRRRDPHNKNAPRTIDVDLVMYNDLSATVVGHSIPDPEILTRSFLAVPLAEIAPAAVHPGSGETLQQIAARLSVESELKLRDDVQLNKDPSWLTQ